MSTAEKKPRRRRMNSEKVYAILEVQHSLAVVQRQAELAGLKDTAIALGTSMSECNAEVAQLLGAAR